MVGGGTAWTTTSQGNSIVPYLSAARPAAAGRRPSSPTTPQGFISLAAGNFAAVTTATSGTTTTNNGTLSTAATLSAPTTLNCAVDRHRRFARRYRRLTLTSGALASAATATNTNPILFGAAGAGEAVVSPVAVTLTLNGALTTTGLTKASSGTLVLGTTTARR